MQPFYYFREGYQHYILRNIVVNNAIDESLYYFINSLDLHIDVDVSLLYETPTKCTLFKNLSYDEAIKIVIILIKTSGFQSRNLVAALSWRIT